MFELKRSSAQAPLLLPIDSWVLWVRVHSVVLLDVRLLVAADVNAAFLSLDILPDLRHDDERVKDLVWELIIFGELRYVGSNIQLEVVNR